ncbi:MAG: polysaccharide deacetylase [Clostridia bacterium]|nr:polysaccharide deacetylase [Clostridia bacterium]
MNKDTSSQEEMQKKSHLYKGIVYIAMILLFLAVGWLGFRLFSFGEPIKTTSSEPTSLPKATPAIPPAREQNDLLKIATEVPDTGEKYCYLTFDDGPTKEVTPAVLDALKAENVKATFFLLGRMIEKNPDIAKRVHEEGHLLANHTYSHQYEELYATGESFLAEVEKTNGLIKDIIGEEPFRLIRFPGGSQNAGTYGAQKQQYKLLLQENGFYFADWNSLNGDAEGHNRSPGELLARIRETSGSKNIVVLMHDAATKKSTPQALSSIIQYLREKGYTFKRLDEVPYYTEDHLPPEPDLIL